MESLWPKVANAVAKRCKTSKYNKKLFNIGDQQKVYL